MNGMFNAISWTSLAVAFLCSILIVIDEIRHPQKVGRRRWDDRDVNVNLGGSG